MATRGLISIGLVCAVSATATARAQGPLTFDEALTMARDRAPRVAVAKARIDEARSKRAGANIRFRDNPVVDASSGPRRLESGTVADREFGISQTFELGDRRGSRIAEAEAGIAREAALSDASIRQVVHAVAVAFVRALQAQARIEILRASEALAKEALEVAGRRFRAGDIALLDVNVARGAVSRASSLATAAEADRSSAIGEMKALLAWRDAADLMPVGNLTERIQAGVDVSVVSIVDRPDVRALEAERAEARATIRLGQALKKPDVGLGLRVGREEDHQAAAGLFSISLPLFSNGQEQRATGLARERRVVLERSVLISELEARARAARETFRLRVSAIGPVEHDVIPGLEENERLARRSFEVGELSLPDLLVIRREFLDIRLLYVESLADAALASIDWQMAAGVLR